MVSEDLDCEGVGGLLELVDDGVVERILVLLKPASQVVGHSASVVNNGKVVVRLAGLWRLGLDEATRLSEMVVVQLLLEGLVSSLGEHGLFLKDGEETHFLKRK